MHGRYLLALLTSVLLVGPASAGPISVFTEVWQAGGDNSGQIPVSGLGNWATLTWGSGPVGPVVTVPADQTTASQPVVGFWPVMQFSNLAQYQAQSTTVVTIPPTQVQLYAEVWDGAYGAQGVPVQKLLINASVSAQFSPAVGQNSVDWQFISLPVQVGFGDGTVVSLDYHTVRMPDGVPQIQFQDGTPTIGFPGPTYYPTLVDADVTVSRPPTDPGSGNTGTPATPEPSSAVLLALGSLVARRYRHAPVDKTGGVS
jgi:hypothetical protein